MTVHLRVWYWLLMTMHELRCKPGLYNVHKGDIGCVVIHQPCGRVWTAM